MSGIKAVFGFDMETDVGSWSSAYEGFRNGTPVLLDILARHGVPATFFITGDGARKNAGMVRTIRAAGHEIGCHTLFHETIGEPLFEIPGMVPILPEEVEYRIELATAWVEEVAGVRPRSFRCPRLFGSTAVVTALEKLGYVADATYPMYFFREQLAPYHPSREDWTKKGELKLLELPNFADLSMASRDPYGRDLDQWPLFRTESAEALMRHIEGYCAYSRGCGVEPFLCFYLHPWEFWEMPQGPIESGEGSVTPKPFLVKNCGAYAAEQFEVLLGLLRGMGAEFYRACDLTRFY